MYFDALTLAAVADEFRATILGGRVQRVLLPDATSVGLEVYAHRQRYQLLASAHTQFARVHLVSTRLSRGVEHATPLLLLLRKYVLGGYIESLEQPHLERILILSIVKERETCNHEDTKVPEANVDVLRCELVIETMERRSNIILVDDDNLILDSVKRVTSQMSYRVILPRVAYELPQKQPKLDPTTATASEVASVCEQREDESAMVRGLVKGYRGVSPQLAREVVYRARHTADAGAGAGPGDADTRARQLAEHLRTLWGVPPEPSLAYEEDMPVAYAPYMITHRGGVCSQPGVSAALETFYRARQDVTAHHQHRQHIVQQLDETRQRLEHQRSQLEIEQERARELETMRWEGEMLFAFLHTITPGQTVLEVEGHQIKLDPERTPVECAQRRFRAYEKAKSGLEHISARLRETENRLAGVEQLCVLMEVADSREQIDQIAQEAEEQGYIGKDGRAQQRGGKPQGKARDSGKKKKKPRAPRLKPLHLVSSDGFDLYVGRSATQNDEVTFRIGRPDDLWLHVRGIPGAHVIIRSGGHDVPERTLHEAGGLAAYFSRARTETMVDVEVARRKHVRRVSGGPPGLVTYRVEQTVRVAPTPPWGT